MSQSKVLLAFEQERIARLLVNYLQSQQIQAEYVRSSADYPHGVKLLNIVQLQLAEQIAQEFIANPQDKKYQQAAWQSGSSVELNHSSSFSGLNVWQHLRKSPFSALIFNHLYRGLRLAKYRFLPAIQLVNNSTVIGIVG